jgi:Xaa-Pro aminopeptidase
MRLSPSDVLAARHRRLQDALAREPLDALVVTNPSNIRYLTNHGGSAGIVVVTADALHLLVDFRYQEAVSTLQTSTAACPTLQLRSVPASYDAALADLLTELSVARVGIEAAHLTVARHEWLTKTLASSVRSTSLCSTQRLIEQLRLIKDPFELQVMRDAAARLEAVVDQSFQLYGGARPSATSPGRSNGRFERPVTNVRRSTPSSRRARIPPCHIIVPLHGN